MFKPSDLDKILLSNCYNQFYKLNIKDLDELLDNTHGMGCMGVNRDIDYLGFTVKMDLIIFELLVPPRNSELEVVDIIFERLINGEKIASPTLFVSWLKKYNMWLVESHEGRGRVMALRKLYKETAIDYRVPTAITVHIIPERLRSSNLTSEMLNAKFISQREAKFYDYEKEKFPIDPIYTYNARS